MSRSIPAALLAVHEVHKSFDHGRVPALRGVSCEIRHGEAVALSGRSGSGKTTLLNILCGLLRPDAGSVSFEGHAPGSQAAWADLRARRIGIVLQDHHLLPTLDARENVELPMLGQVGSAKQRQARALDLLRRVGIAELAGRRPGQMSGGQRQRVAIARSLANRPVLLLADEPTGNLDSATAAEVLGLIGGLRREDGLTVVVVTHDPQVAASCGRTLRLHDGLIAPEESSPPAGIASNQATDHGVRT